MLVLFETAAGFAIFKLLDEKKLRQVDDLYKCFETPEGASQVVKLKHFQKFEDTTEALAAATALVEGKMSKSLKKLLKKVVAKDAHAELAVVDAKLGNVIKEKTGLSCIATNEVMDLTRCIRSQAASLIQGIDDQEMKAMGLGLSHSLSRYKLKFSPEKVDTMIVQAISLLDDLDKELNNYIMRCREWYGWHFPELSKVITDNIAFVRAVRAIGDRTNAETTDLSEILEEEVEADVKKEAARSMGTETKAEDIESIWKLCDQILEISEYREQLYVYLKNRMQAIAPNLTVLVGDLVGARLIAHAGSLLSLAKHPASTVQILGAEKALFRALKKKHNTPKYGLLYHASLVGQSTPKNKGKIARVLAAKASLASRVDALSEDTRTDIGVEHRAIVETRVQMCNENMTRRLSGTGKARAKTEKFSAKSEVKTYNSAEDSSIAVTPGKTKKRKRSEVEEEAEEEVEEATVAESTPKTKKSKKEKKKKKEKELESD